MEMKEKKTGAIIGTIAAILLCGCPGLGLCIGGILTAANIMPWYGDFFGTYAETLPSWIGYVFLCVAILFIAIAILVPVLTLRKKKEPVEAEVVSNEHLPPASMPRWPSIPDTPYVLPARLHRLHSASQPTPVHEQDWPSRDRTSAFPRCSSCRM